MTHNELQQFNKWAVYNGDGCWVWVRCKTAAGYGTMWLGRIRKKCYAHRLAYEHYIGVIPKGLTVDHLCRNRACVNPTHLEMVTLKENGLRGVSPSAVNARKTHCPRGHLYATWNTVMGRRSDGRTFRMCTICHRQWCRARNKKLRSHQNAVLP